MEDSNADERDLYRRTLLGVMDYLRGYEAERMAECYRNEMRREPEDLRTVRNAIAAALGVRDVQ